MESRLRAALCALLLLHWGSAEHDDGRATATIASQSGGGEMVPMAPVAESAPAPSLDSVSHAVPSRSPSDPGASPSSGVTVHLSDSTASEGRSSPLTPGAKTDDGTNIVSPSEAAVPGNDLADQMTSQSPPSGSHAPTSHIGPASATIGTPDAAPTAPAVIAVTTAPPAATSRRSALPLPDSSTQSHRSRAPPSTPKSEATTASAVAQSSPAPSTGPPQEPPTSVSPSLAPTQNTLPPGRRAETSSVAKQTSSLATTSSTSAQTKVHAHTPSQLNVGGDTWVDHESPTLDPLLAGLVSAFIITAVIITLLLFLKLRQRDNRPEFRRLQDLPMDDMMEDTPLSMYSY